MSIFKENLTSKLLQEASIKIVNKQNSISKILELGCGDGNISKYVLKNQKIKNVLCASDISSKAIKIAKKKFEQKIPMGDRITSGTRTPPYYFELS